MLNRPQPEHEVEIVVASADQKGIVLRRQPDDPPAKAHTTKGDKAIEKRMATVPTVYMMDRNRRTAEESPVRRRAGAQPGPAETARQGGGGRRLRPF